MHTFIDNIIAFSLKNKFFIFFCTAIAVIAGAVSFIHTPVDAFPDVTNTKVTIITQWPGRSAEEIEKFITIPIEIAMNPVQKKTDIRSTTLFGLSVINVMFDDDADDFYARQQVYNLLNDADLPEGVTPDVQPQYGPTGEIFRYTLRSDKRTVRELKTFQDWVIERKLRAVPGVADIVSFGGEVKTFEVSVNPNQLINYNVTSLELFDAIAKSNINVGGDVITKSSQAYVVRGIGLINDTKEIENIVVKNIKRPRIEPAPVGTGGTHGRRRCRAGDCRYAERRESGRSDCRPERKDSGHTGKCVAGRCADCVLLRPRGPGGPGGTDGDA